MPFDLNDNSSRVPKDYRMPLVVFLALSLVCCLFYAGESDDGTLHGIQKTFSGIISSATAVGADFKAAIDASATEKENASASDSTLSELEAEVAELEAELALTKEYYEDLVQLQDLFNMVDLYDITGAAGHVIGLSTESYNQTVTADVGTDKGVKVGQCVLGSSGVIGQVISATASTCTIRLLTDPASGVSVLIQSNRAQGIVTGSLEGLLYLEDVDSTVNVQVGDVIVTSGLGGSYVRGLIVGKVVKVTASQGDSSRLIVVAPNETTGALQNVFIVATMGSLGAAA